MCEDFAANFGDKRTGCCITTTHRLTHSSLLGEMFYQKQQDSRPLPTLLFFVSAIEVKTERQPF
jgi:hypothetical protein